MIGLLHDIDCFISFTLRQSSPLGFDELSSLVDLEPGSHPAKFVRLLPLFLVRMILSLHPTVVPTSSPTTLKSQYLRLHLSDRTNPSHSSLCIHRSTTWISPLRLQQLKVHQPNWQRITLMTVQQKLLNP